MSTNHWRDSPDPVWLPQRKRLETVCVDNPWNILPRVVRRRNYVGRSVTQPAAQCPSEPRGSPEPAAFSFLDDDETADDDDMGGMGTSNYAKERAWDSIRPELYHAYVTQLPQQRELDQHLAGALVDYCQGVINKVSGSSSHGSNSSSSGSDVRAAAAAAAGGDDSNTTTTTTSSSSSAPPTCLKCGGALAESHRVPVLVIDLSSRVQLEVPVMRCSNDGCRCTTAVKPLDLSCWPCNPGKAYDITTAGSDEQQTWFTLRLMQYTDITAMVARRVPMYRFCQVIESSHALMGFQPAVNRLDEVLRPASMQYGYLQCWLADLRNHGVELPRAMSGGPAADCAGCCLQAASEQGLHSVSVDFNFKLTHLASATRNWEEYEPPNAKYFLPSSMVREFAANPANMARPPNAGKDCSEFAAAEVLARRQKQRDVTAVGAVVCRHGIPMLAMDIDTGERYCYATLFLVQLLLVHCIVLRFVWYDINCRYAAHFLLWVARQSADLQSKLEAVVAKLRFPLPVFHQHAHSAQCQRKHGALQMEGAGRPPGEPVENMWAVLGEHGWSTQYMHLHNRRGFLERALLWYAMAAAARLPETLVSMLRRAVEQRARAATQIAAITASLALATGNGDQEVNQAQVLQWLADFRAAGSEANAAADAAALFTWKVEWVKLKLQLFYIQQDRGTQLPGISVTFADKTFSAAASKLEILEKKLRVLERKHVAPGTAMPEVGTAEFAPYLQEYITYEVQSLCGSLRLASIDYLQLDRYYNKLAGRPQLQKAVQSNQQRTAKAMTADLDKLQQLLSKGFDHLPTDVRTSVAGHAGWTLEDLKGGRLFEVRPPTTGSRPAAAAASEQDAGWNVLLSRLDFHVQEYARAKEEVKLVVQEMSDALKCYDMKGEAISNRQQQLQAEFDESVSSTAVVAGPDGGYVHMAATQAWRAGLLWHLQQQLQRHQGLHDRACGLFQPALSRHAATTVDSSLPLADAEQQQAAMDLEAVDTQGAVQLVQDPFMAAYGLDAVPEDAAPGPDGDEL